MEMPPGGTAQASRTGARAGRSGRPNGASCTGGSRRSPRTSCTRASRRSPCAGRASGSRRPRVPGCPSRAGCPGLTRRSRRSRRTRVSGCACRTSHAGCPSLTQVLAASAQLSVDASPTRSWRGHTSWRGTCPPSVCSEDALNSLWDQCVLNKIRGMVEKSLRIEATTRIRPWLCNRGGRNQTASGGSMIRFYLFGFTTG